MSNTRPITIVEFLQDKTYEERLLVSQALDIYDKYRAWRKNRCCYCDKELTKEELASAPEMFFACGEHKPWEGMFDVDAAKEMIARGEYPKRYKQL